jgi:transcriptional regulator with XRE-family HTH domain
MKSVKGKGALPPIAEYLGKQIDIAGSMGKTQRDISEEIGYERPNMVSMMRTGDTKVPIEKVPALARALNVDPAFLMRLAIQQYWKGDNLKAIAEVFGTIVSKNEVKILEVIRDVTKNADPRLTPDLERKLRAALK